MKKVTIITGSQARKYVWLTKDIIQLDESKLDKNAVIEKIKKLTKRTTLQFRKPFVVLLILCAMSLPGFSQSYDTFYANKLPINYDTFRVEKVLIKHQLINTRNGKVMRHWWTKTKVKSGYILRQPDGMFVINGKIMEPDNFSYKTAIAKTQ